MYIGLCTFACVYWTWEKYLFLMLKSFTPSIACKIILLYILGLCFFNSSNAPYPGILSSFLWLLFLWLLLLPMQSSNQYLNDILYNSFQHTAKLIVSTVFVVKGNYYLIPYNRNNPQKKILRIVKLFQFTRKRSWMVIVLHKYIKLSGTIILLLLYSDQHLLATCHIHFSNEGCHCRSLTKQYAPMQ